MRNYGLKFDVITKEDYKFGTSPIPLNRINPSGDWTEFLPVKELQNQGYETYACVVFTVLNCIEILIKYIYGEDRNYSDRFLATLVNTRGGGSSPKEVSDFLRKIGVVPQDLWPFDLTIDSEDKFFEKIPPKLYELAQEFNKEWDFKYEVVPANNEAISAAIQCSPLLISVYAWTKNENGFYYRPAGFQDIHATTMISQRHGEFRRVFDSYDAPHIKDYDWNSMPMAINRFWIKKKETVKKKWFQVIIDFVKSLWS